VLRYTPGDTNAVVEITNNVGRRLVYYWEVVGTYASFGEIVPHQTALVSLPISDPWMGPEIRFHAELVNRPWINGIKIALERIGIYSSYLPILRFNLTNTTEWMYPRLDGQ
jgi:hypothetical protein